MSVESSPRVVLDAVARADLLLESLRQFLSAHIECFVRVLGPSTRGAVKSAHVKTRPSEVLDQQIAQSECLPKPLRFFRQEPLGIPQRNPHAVAHIMRMTGPLIE